MAVPPGYARSENVPSSAIERVASGAMLSPNASCRSMHDRLRCAFATVFHNPVKSIFTSIIHIAMYVYAMPTLMPNRRSDAPLDYLQTASNASLESYELSRLNHAANLRREIAALIDQWIDETVEARLARCVLEERAQQRATQRQSLVPQRQLPFEVASAPELAFHAVHAVPLRLPRRDAKSPVA
jgi:hypothetical protein